jgi:hypothetical protein
VITTIVRGHVVERPGREISDTQAISVAAGLLAAGIHVVPVVDVFHTLHLWAQQPTTTPQEVAALRAFHAVTDVRMAWHPAEVAS